MVLPARRRRIRRSAGLLPPFKGLYDDHASAAARARRAEVLRRIGIIGARWRSDVQEFAGKREAGLAGGAGEQAVVADAVEAARQDMEQEAANELVGAKRHDLLAIGAVAAVTRL